MSVDWIACATRSPAVTSIARSRNGSGPPNGGTLGSGVSDWYSSCAGSGVRNSATTWRWTWASAPAAPVMPIAPTTWPAVTSWPLPTANELRCAWSSLAIVQIDQQDVAESIVVERAGPAVIVDVRGARCGGDQWRGERRIEVERVAQLVGTVARIRRHRVVTLHAGDLGAGRERHHDRRRRDGVGHRAIGGIRGAEHVDAAALQQRAGARAIDRQVARIADHDLGAPDREVLLADEPDTGERGDEAGVGERGLELGRVDPADGVARIDRG